jgi:hypothetical protein
MVGVGVGQSSVGTWTAGSCAGKVLLGVGVRDWGSGMVAANAGAVELLSLVAVRAGADAGKSKSESRKRTVATKTRIMPTRLPDRP